MPTQESTQQTQQTTGEPVTLYVYDLSMGLANTFSRQFVGQHFEGIWHTGIVVFGTEYFFGGGVCAMQPGTTPYGTPVKKIDLGVTTKTKQEFESFLQKISVQRYKLSDYNLFTRNCNHFTDECAQFLVGKQIPQEIRGLPEEFLKTPIGQMMRGFIDNLMTQGIGQQQDPVLNMMNQFQGFTPFGNQTFQQQQPVQNVQPQQQVKEPEFSDDKTIYRYPKANVSMIIKKLKTIIIKEKVQLSSEERNTLLSLEKMLSSDSPIESKVIQEVCDLFKKLVENIPEKQVFPVFDLIRLFFLSQNVTKSCQQKGGLLDTIFTYLKQWKTLSMPSQMMLLRILCNMFSPRYNPQCAGANYIIGDSERFTTVVDCISDSLSAKKETIRQTGASLACNLSLYVPRKETDAETQLLCSLVEFVKEETDKDAVGKMLLALYRLIQGDTQAQQLVKTLEFSCNSQDHPQLVGAIKKMLM